MADRYWVGGTGTWNTTNTANWSNVSGGAGGFSVPTAADNVFFDTASGLSNYVVSTSTGLTLSCLNLTIARATLGTVTFIDTGVFAVAGNLDITATGVTWSAFGSWTFTATAARTIKTDGIVLPAVTLNGTGGGSWQLLSDLSTALTQSFTLTAGTLDLNNFNLRCGQFSSNNSNVRSLVFGTGVVNLTGSGVLWSASSNTNFTMTGSRVINAITATTSGVREIQVGTWTAAAAPSVNVIAGTSQFLLTGSLLDVNTTGFTGRLNAGTRTIHGNLTLGAGSTIQNTANATTFAPTGISVLTTNGVVVDLPISLSGTGTLQLADNLTTGNTTFALLQGTLDLNAKTVNLFALNTNSAPVRGIIGTDATLNLFGNNTTIAVFATTTNLTLTGLPTINCTYSGSVGVRTITGGAFTESASFNLRITGGSDTINLTGSYRTLDMTGFTGILGNASKTLFGNYILGVGMTVTDGAATTTLRATSGTFDIDLKGVTHPQNITVAGVGGTHRQLGNVNLSSRSATLNGGTWDLNNFTLTTFSILTTTTSVKSFAFGTTGVINLTGNNTTVWSFANSTGFSYTGNARVNLTYSGAVGTRTITHGTTAGGNSVTKAPPIYVTAGTDTIVTTATSHLSDLVFTGSSSTLTNTARILYGNLVLSSGLTLSVGASTTTFSGDGNTQTLDTATKTLDFPITVGANRISPLTGVTNTNLVLANNAIISDTKTLTLFSGTFNTGGYNLSVGSFSSTNTNTRTVNITNSTVTLTATTGVQWDMLDSTDATVTSTDSTIDIASTGTTTRTFNGGSKTYNNLNIGGATGTSILNIVGNNTFTGTVSSTKTVAHTIQFVAGSTTTINNWSVNGSSGNLVTITSATGAGHNLVKSGAGTINVQYTNVRYSNASPANKWYALIVNNNVDLGDNTGWVFVAPPSSSSNFFLLF
jgi:hypothetical protein